VSAPPFLTLPSGAVARTISTPRGQFAAFEAAGPPGGPTAILVPGLTGSKEDFIAVLEPLARAGYRVIAYDQRGQYETPGSTPNDPGVAEPSAGVWDLTEFAADLIAVAAATHGGPVHVVGHSFGGLVARAAALAEPARFRSLVLLDSGPAAVPRPHSDTLTVLAAVLETHGLGAVWELRQAADREAGVGPPADPAVQAFLRTRFFANDPASLAAMARILATEPDRTDELARTGIPILVAFGANDLDSWPPEIQAELASRLGVPHVSFPEAAHSPAAESPTDTAHALVSFWSGVERAG
jgi:pimeloyl-ACP methyl ester carboxylesterase